MRAAKPKLEPIGQALHHALYMVRGGRRDGWFIAKRWTGAEPSMHSRPLRRAPQDLTALDFPHDYESVEKEIR